MQSDETWVLNAQIKSTEKHKQGNIKSFYLPVEGEHNQGIACDAQHPNDEDEHSHNVVSMVRYIHLVVEAALGVCFLGLHVLSGPHGSNTSSGLATW